MAAWVSLSFAVSHHGIKRRVMCVCPLEEVFRPLRPFHPHSAPLQDVPAAATATLLVPETMTRWGHPNHPAVFGALRARLSSVIVCMHETHLEVSIPQAGGQFDRHLTLVIFRQNQKHFCNIIPTWD